ncbi:mitochondrial import inner membrane translocase subunit Tim21 isoform X2 [Cephus cinctus]|uniref:Mitochondrial import inner membrane translocase subunit Tim21 n=1 Tax=Cephus cinctus TaxID=211228 RepID=A0AAJ7BXS0_CEPCN|nr:mitochondrial import inner membrane translocase subunit Tim21 isoform X2 [Cephus cinctus]
MATTRAIYHLLRQRHALLSKFPASSYCVLLNGSLKNNIFQGIRCSSNKSVPTTTSKTNSKVGYIDVGSVKENTKVIWYSVVILIGLGVTIVIGYTILKELFSNESPNAVYNRTLKRCLEDTTIESILGPPITAHASNQPGRRGRLSYYDGDGYTGMKIQFYIKGTREKATVQADLKNGKDGVYEYIYLIVQVQNYAHNIIVLEDNRHELNTNGYTNKIIQNETLSM